MNELQPATRPTAWRITDSMVWFALGANLLLFGLRTELTHPGIRHRSACLPPCWRSCWPR